MRRVSPLLTVFLVGCGLLVLGGCSENTSTSPEPTAASQVPGKVAPPADGNVQAKPKMALPPP